MIVAAVIAIWLIGSVIAYWLDKVWDIDEGELWTNGRRMFRIFTSVTYQWVGAWARVLAALPQLAHLLLQMNRTPHNGSFRR